ncbi:MAG: hypothetical protein D6706_19050 [Chloroflexi bacterium]|nr:MAG: hypothetical protein D6706_19050 [Chloroflexota bacterium]
MSKSQIDVAQLQRRDPSAWTALLRQVLQTDDVVVTAVSAEPLPTSLYQAKIPHLVRYTLALRGHSDPITCIAKRTNRRETIFYRQLAPHLPQITPRCWFSYLDEEQGWIILDDIPRHHLPTNWSAEQVETVIQEMAFIHATFWNREEELAELGFPYFIGNKVYSLKELREEQAIYFEQGPGAIISSHALQHAGNLAPLLVQAANGLTVLQELGGWPGIITETHLQALSDLLDDPLPMIAPLRELPLTLLHGDPHSRHWQLTLFNEFYLTDWHKLSIGPSVLDLVNFLEQFDLLFVNNEEWQLVVREERPITDETMIDTYLLALSGLLPGEFNARLVRQAIPAAQCLYVLTGWMSAFANWFAQKPSKITWQKVNKMNDEELKGTVFRPLVAFRPYLNGVFNRFLQAYRKL